MFFIDLFQIVEIIGAPGVDAFMDDEVLAVFLMDKCIAAVGTAQDVLARETVLLWGKVGITDFAFDLPALSVIAVKVRFWGIAGRTLTIVRDVAVFTSCNRFDLFVVFGLKVRDEKVPVPFILTEADPGKFIGLELLIFRGMGIVKSPLFKRDVFADKKQ